MSSKEELMRPVLVMGFFVFAVLAIISLLYLLSRLYIYRKYKNNLMKTKANTREQEENEEENITVKIKVNKNMLFDATDPSSASSNETAK